MSSDEGDVFQLAHHLEVVLPYLAPVSGPWVGFGKEGGGRFLG